MNSKAVELVRTDCETVLKGRVEQLGPLKNQMLVFTGGTGFVGTWVAELIATLNDSYSFGTQVVLIARRTDLFKKRYPHLAHRKDMTFLSSDVRYTVEVPRDTAWMIHAAANPDNRFHSSHPIETMSVIADGTSAVLKAADRCAGLRMFLNFSSGLIYGPQPMDLPRISEGYLGAPEVGRASSAYAEAKRYAETLCAAAQSQARLPLVTVRPFAFLGPYQSLDTPWAINNFMKDALGGNSIRVLGDGKTVRSYLYGSDLAYWILRVLTGSQVGQCFNIGSADEITLDTLAKKIAQICQPQVDVRLYSSGSAAIQRSRFVPDVSLAQDMLGLTESVSLETAIQRTILWNQYVEKSE